MFQEFQTYILCMVRWTQMPAIVQVCLNQELAVAYLQCLALY